MTIAGIGAELGPLVKLVKLLPFGSIRQTFAVQERVEVYGQQAISNLKYYTKNNGTGKSTSIFSRMLDGEKNPDLSDYDIEHEASNLIVAGSDTTAVSLTYTIWALLRPQNKRVKERLIEELIASESSQIKIHYAALPYLNAVIKEGLRLYGAAPGSLPRIVPAGGTVFGSYAIPEGTTVSTQAYTLHRDAQIYVDPEE